MSKVMFIQNLTGGGAERVAVNIFKALGFDYIVLLDDTNIAYEVPHNKIYNLNSPSSKNIVLKIIKLAIRAIKLRKFKDSKNVSLCLSFLEPCNLINILTKKNEKVILSFHTHYSLAFSEDTYIHKIKLTRKLIMSLYKLMFRLFYNKADIAIAVSKATAIDLIKNWGLKKEKVKVIYNPIYYQQIQESAKENLNQYESIFKHPVILTTGRLTKPKGQWYLIRIFKELKKEFPDLKLVILGNGELKDYLVKLSEELELKTYVWDRDELSENYNVYFLGFQKNPFKFMANSTLFVFPSLFEGFGYVVVESLSCGVPVISSDCKTGPREILAPDTDVEYQTKEPEFAKYGVLMPVFDIKFKQAKDPLDDVEKMWIDTIKKMLNDKNLRKQYSEAGKFRAKEFDVDVIIQEWKNVLEVE